MPYKGAVRFPDINKNKEPKTISLREAAQRTQKGVNRDKIKCNCTSSCQKGRCSCRSAGLDCNSHCHPKNHSCLNKEVIEEDSSKIAERKRRLVVKSEPKKKRWRGTLKADFEAIEKNSWLGDEHIEAANCLLRNQFPNQAGFYHPVLGQRNSFPITKDSFIQILNVQGNHWITVVGIPPSLVHIYDSVYNYTSDDTKLQVAAILSTNESEITFKIQKVQFQKGSNDCGLFSIAFATDLAHGNDPISCKYKQNELRSHFLDCLEKNMLVPFPKDILKSMKKPKPKCERFSVHCSCRLPDNGQEKMAKCGQCNIWYHQSCENIPNKVFQVAKAPWKCSQCT